MNELISKLQEVNEKLHGLNIAEFTTDEKSAEIIVDALEKVCLARTYIDFAIYRIKMAKLREDSRK